MGSSCSFSTGFDGSKIGLVVTPSSVSCPKSAAPCSYLDRYFGDRALARRIGTSWPLCHPAVTCTQQGGEPQCHCSWEEEQNSWGPTELEPAEQLSRTGSTAAASSCLPPVGAHS